MIDHDKLAQLAALAVPREELQRWGYRNLCKYGDLHRLGYIISLWLHPESLEQILEYTPQARVGVEAGPCRLTARTFAEQADIHRALGLNLVPAGSEWEDYGSPGLFDEQFFEPTLSGGFTDGQSCTGPVGDERS